MSVAQQEPESPYVPPGFSSDASLATPLADSALHSRQDHQPLPSDAIPVAPLSDSGSQYSPVSSLYDEENNFRVGFPQNYREVSRDAVSMEELDAFQAERGYENDRAVATSSDETIARTLAEAKNDRAVVTSSNETIAQTLAEAKVGYIPFPSTESIDGDDGVNHRLGAIARKQLESWFFSSSPSTEVLRQPDSIQSILKYLDLAELVKFGHASTATRHVMKATLLWKAESVIDTFFHDSSINSDAHKIFFENFWKLMTDSASCIHGSATRTIVYRPGLHPRAIPGQPSNLNISISNGTGPEWHSFMMDAGSAAPVVLDIYPNSNPNHSWVARRVQYTIIPGRPIVIMEAAGPSSIEAVIATAETTSHTAFILPDFVWFYYPRHAVASRALDTYRGPSIRLCLTMDRKGDKRSMSTAGWDVICGIWDMYKLAVQSFWVPEELDLSKDLVDWNEKLNDRERQFIMTVLAFFAAADGIVNENLVERFSSEIQVAEARSFYGFQIMMENVHSETYSLLIDTYVKDPGMRDHLFRSIETVPSIRQKADWMLKWMDAERPFAEPGTKAFTRILPAYCFLFLRHKPDGDTVNQIIREAVAIEQDFVGEALASDLIGMNPSLLSQYVEYVADRLSINLGAPKPFDRTNPFDFMDLISLEGKTNFFEKRVSEYSKAFVSSDPHESRKTFELDAEF
ncbi:Ribonucleotide reductase small subunit [Mycena venus]|uniref:Ribonucleotide reductase small subunit n=1 Tax=Mycena venus TaxID=2733690 RepID=A0A8H7CK96_9AGAR|nr:Ribonucleotide reductase small subunit [Mycena venus]